MYRGNQADLLAVADADAKLPLRRHNSTNIENPKHLRLETTSTAKYAKESKLDSNESYRKPSAPKFGGEDLLA